MSDIQDNEKLILVNLTSYKTSNDPNSAATFAAVDVEDDDDEGTSDYKNILENVNLSIDKSEKLNPDDKGDEDKGNDKKDNDKDDRNDKEKPNDADNDKPKQQTEKSFAKLIFEFKLKRLEKNENLERLQLYSLNLGDPCYLIHNQCKHGSCLSHTSTKWSCKCDGKSFFNEKKLITNFFFF